MEFVGREQRQRRVILRNSASPSAILSERTELSIENFPPATLRCKKVFASLIKLKHHHKHQPLIKFTRPLYPCLKELGFASCYF